MLNFRHFLFINNHFLKTITSFIIYFILFLQICFANPVKKDTTTVERIVATSFATFNPILKGLAANPVIKIKLELPASIQQKSFQKIKININSSAVSTINKLDVFLTNTDEFSSANLIGSIIPTHSSIDLPVAFKASSGTSYIWLSATLKNDAPVSNKIEIHCSKLIDELNREINIKESSFSYAKLTGFAIRKIMDDSVNSYRIPGFVTTNKGTLIAVYDVRYNSSRDLPGNIDVGMSRSTDKGNTWQPMKVIMDMGEPQKENGIGDPSILFDPITKKIWVAALWSKGNHSIAGSKPGLSPDESGQFILVNSSDDGLTWSSPINITSQVKNPDWKILFQGPGNGIAMRDGKLVFPAQYWDSTKMPYSTIVYSADHGNTWKRAGNGAKSNTTEAQVVETNPGTLMLNMRDNRGKFRSVSTTNDMGKTWMEHATSYHTFPDPICQGSIIKAKVKIGGMMKDILFFSNDNSSSKRNSITIKASLDYGETWQSTNQLLIDERSCYGYSCLTKIDENTIGILYEGIREIYFVSVPVKDIIKK
ncbi:sialidase precursor [mine drainage metagenome]|uniref:Sialidase n=1 Tax=mine drainage metagenome TaxID=410659 RepID=A0A1J5T7L2_9ZZZZ